MNNKLKYFKSYKKQISHEINMKSWSNKYVKSFEIQSYKIKITDKLVSQSV